MEQGLAVIALQRYMLHKMDKSAKAATGLPQAGIDRQQKPPQ